MAVLINKQTGLAENVQGQPDFNLYEVPLFDAQGQAMAVPFQEAQKLVQQGYRQPSPEELQSALNFAKYNSGIEQAKTFAEGAASAATLGLSTGVQVATGISEPEDIAGRREANPGVYMAGQATGLVGSALTGVGSAPLMTQTAARLVPTLGATAVTRIGTTAAKAAIENMVFQAGDEASKAFMGDPNQTASSIIQDVGLAGLIGGAGGAAFGGASELWKLGPGKQLTNLLKTVENRSAGIPDDLKAAANIDVPIELEAALSDNEAARKAFQTLNEANTSSGAKVQSALDRFKTDIKDAVLESVGTNADDAINLSEADLGNVVKKQLTDKFKEIADPITSKFDEFSKRFKDTGIGEYENQAIQEKLAAYAADSGALKAPLSAENELIQRVLKEMPLQTTAEDLRLYALRLGQENPFGSESYYAAKQIRRILTDAQENLLEMQVQKDAPELLADFAGLKKEYSNLKGLIEDLNDRLHAGRSGGIQSFLENIKAMSPEDVVRRLSVKNDTEGMALLQNMFPDVAQSIKQAEIAKVVKKSLTNGEFNPSKFFKQLDALPPEMRSFLFDEKAVERIGALRELASRVPSKANPSGTARTLDALWSKVPAGAVGMATAMNGGQGIMAALATHAGVTLAKEIPDAARLAMLKFLASGDKISAPGFKAMTQAAGAVIRFQRTFEQAAQATIGTGGKLVASVSASDLDKLDKQIEALQTNPEKLMALGGSVGDYMPDAAAALADQTGRAAQYLASLKPVTTPLNPLDPDRVPSKVEEARYKSALTIAQSPLTVFTKIKNNTVTQNDIADLQAMYPGLYERMVNQLMSEVIDAKAKKVHLPMGLKTSLGRFVNMPLDASATPMNLQMNQKSLITQPANQNSPGVIKNPGKLDKLPGLMASPTEKRQMQAK